ncbi:cysteine-rich receptor-like protein kinase 44 [Ziziphus jujuba]|uniref:Cysteine-rich receptor-like protein kinase 44 n=1 Tax=Ziziphus jujuba TaxID=326968 RepID=A0ABM4A5P9_ZIZJJ|nr:cysteine-rich receptor-like protein kinase 44 [Ziziphus jujuba var. spinosa]XP_048318815.1 cysteine-rich receptor-like protein kinase 44 [Ziziphus jujuba var. spinosa]XP_048330148.1 cysteine-rich receptor-like protein kinase 44 [Ziziphus jujuba var. spinosa]XP_048332710.1 cysteine-rich receptor-like protein kinase 44 [Ziziphus jujuba var. spinosa]XP_060672057.1 cysteine-rich receptor-like protein kinase 44 [Ziziphus jujuba]
MAHRGIKTANILVDDALNAKISDFGNPILYAEDGQDNEFKVIKVEATRGYIINGSRVPNVWKDIANIYVDGYGVVVLEIVSVKKNAENKFNQKQREFLAEEACLAESKHKLLELVDN